MSSDVRAILDERRHRTPMFPRWSNNNMLRDLTLACGLAGIPPVSANDLRRTFATWLARAGVPILHVSKMMGHASTKMLEQVYARVERGQHLHDAITRLTPAGADRARTALPTLSSMSPNEDSSKRPE